MIWEVDKKVTSDFWKKKKSENKTNQLCTLRIFKSDMKVAQKVHNWKTNGETLATIWVTRIESKRFKF